MESKVKKMKEKPGSKSIGGQKQEELTFVLKWANGVQVTGVTVLLLGSSGHTCREHMSALLPCSEFKSQK